MMIADIQQVTISALEAEPNFKDLLAEYAAESAIDGLPPPSAKMEMYKALEKSGALVTWGAYVGGKLVGFITALSTVNPHYGVKITVSESFFVSKEYRKTGAGIKLRRIAEAHTDAIGSVGLLITAPFGSNLAAALPHEGYRETNRVFFRKSKNA
jgi:GNAT superfamily N-acetyltransferase